MFINGRFLSKPVTGTERFAREIVWAMDALLAALPVPPKVTLLCPPGTAAPEGLRVIQFAIAGAHQGHFWEQWDLYRAARGGFLLNLTNSGPVLHGNQLTIIHDAAVYRTPQNFSVAYGYAHRLLGRLLAKRSRIGTVSAFSQGELQSLLHPRGDIPFIPNGHEHITRATADVGVLSKLPLGGKPFFLFVGSPTPNKNLARAIEAFKQMGREDVCFVIVGASKASVFKNQLGELPPTVIMPGRLSDGEIVALYTYAIALVFPSLYEGFGIPPLEAMVHGCPVIAADIPPVREVCGNAALFFDPLSPNTIRQRMQEMLDTPATRTALIASGTARYPHFSWQNSAKTLLGVIGGHA